MRISTKGRYALMIMIDLAQYSLDEPVHLNDIFKRQEISPDYAENILRQLKKVGLVRSTKGPGGGYKLAKEIGQITIKEIVEASEGKLCLVNCVQDKESCKRSKDCLSRFVWVRLSKTIEDFLETLTLEDLLREGKITTQDKITEDEAFGIILNIFEDIKQMLYCLHQTFRRHSLNMLSKARILGRKIDKKSLYAAELLRESQLIHLSYIPCEFERIGDSLESILYSLRTKVEKNIFFSKDALYEVETLFEKAEFIFNLFRDYLKNKDTQKKEAIYKEKDRLTRLINRYGQLNEKRMLNSLCEVDASSIYMDMLDSFKNIFTHIFRAQEGIRLG